MTWCLVLECQNQLLISSFFYSFFYSFLHNCKIIKNQAEISIMLIIINGADYFHMSILHVHEIREISRMSIISVLRLVPGTVIKLKWQHCSLINYNHYKFNIWLCMWDCSRRIFSCGVVSRSRDNQIRNRRPVAQQSFITAIRYCAQDLNFATLIS